MRKTRGRAIFVGDAGEYYVIAKILEQGAVAGLKNRSSLIVRFAIARREKFAAVALSSASSIALTDALEITGGLWILPFAPVNVSRVWREWIGSIPCE